MARLNTMLSGITFLLALLTAANADLTEGTDFLLAFPCSGPNFWSSLIIVNSNSNDSWITIESTKTNFTTIQLTVAANSGQQVNVTDAHNPFSFQVCGWSSAFQLGFRVQSSIPVALYVSQTPIDDRKRYLNAAQYLVLPTNMLSSQYVGTYDGSNHPYDVIIVAKEDGTRITIGSEQVTLNRLDVYCNYYSGASGQISANVPFALILTVPIYLGIEDYSPYQSVMSLPKSYTSTQWTAVAGYNNNYMTLQIWAFESNTQVSINNATNMTVPPSNPYEKTTANGSLIIASKPVQVFDAHTLGYPYTQEMFRSSSVQFYTLASSDSDQPLLVIVVPLASTGNIRLDGRAIPVLQFRRIPYTQDYFYTQTISGPAMLHTISTTTSDDRFLAYVYHGTSSRYGSRYQIAMNLPDKN